MVLCGFVGHTWAAQFEFGELETQLHIPYRGTCTLHFNPSEERIEGVELYELDLHGDNKPVDNAGPLKIENGTATRDFNIFNVSNCLG